VANNNMAADSYDSYLPVSDPLYGSYAQNQNEKAKSSLHLNNVYLPTATS
jgi:hypothetical protein